jgi:hypothetical protein
MWAKNPGEKRIFWLKIFAKIENRATLAEDSDLRTLEPSGEGRGDDVDPAFKFQQITIKNSWRAKHLMWTVFTHPPIPPSDTP